LYTKIDFPGQFCDANFKKNNGFINFAGGQKADKTQSIDNHRCIKVNYFQTT